jgi:hypothetical protein
LRNQVEQLSAHEKTSHHSFLLSGVRSSTASVKISKIPKAVSANSLLNHSEIVDFNFKYNLAPDVSEVQNLYRYKSAEFIIEMLLENLNNPFTNNKNEHLK